MPTFAELISYFDVKHHGVLGMKWGVRKAGTGQPSSHKAAPDHAAAQAALAKIKSGGGTKALSNQELQGLVQRMNLESQYSTLSSRTQTKSLGQRFLQGTAKNIGGIAANVARTQVTNTANMLLKQQIKNALKQHGLT